MGDVYHRGAMPCDDSRVPVVGPEAVATLVIDAGLTTWLLEKVSSCHGRIVKWSRRSRRAGGLI